MKKQFMFVVILLLAFLLPIKVKAYSATAYRSIYSVTVKSSGATDITVKTSQRALIKVYKKKVLSKSQLKWTTSKNLKYTARLSGSNSYYIFVQSISGKKCRIHCEVKQHQDKKTSSVGGIWQADRSSPVPSTSILYLKKFYFTKQHCKQALSYVNNAKYLDYQSRLCNGTLSIGGLMLGGSGIKAAGVASAFLTIAQIGYSVDFKKTMMNKIKRIGNYSSSTKAFRNGVVLTEYMSRGFTFLSVSSWNSKTMTGVPGYTGSWKSR